jgi:hypothetical protein
MDHTLGSIFITKLKTDLLSSYYLLLLLKTNREILFRIQVSTTQDLRVDAQIIKGELWFLDLRST